MVVGYVYRVSGELRVGVRGVELQSPYCISYIHVE